MALHWVLLLAVLAHSVHSELNEVDPLPEIYEPAWVYKCMPNEGGCQRLSDPRATVARGNTTHFNSLSVCRTVCGRFGGLWPRPVTAALSPHTVHIHPQFIRYDLIDVPAESRAILAAMTQVITENIQAECPTNVTENFNVIPVVVYLTVKSASLDLTWDTNEEYLLDVQTKEDQVVVHVTAETVYGARHALETFTQLIAPEVPEFSKNYNCFLHLVAGAKIRDRPAYKHRGFLLDTSRNSMTLNDIKRMVDAMAANKMNVFHWHVTDSQSFPLESSRVPQFTKYGAYSSYDIYTTEEVRELVRYSLVRGVRVVVEIDAPAHAGNGWQWGPEYGHGDLAVCVNANPWRQFCIQPPCGQLNPANPKLYPVLGYLYRDIADMVSGPILLHMGGDEVFFACWNSSQQIADYMKEKNYDSSTEEGFFDLWGEFHNRALKTWDEQLQAVDSSPQPVMLWSSALTEAHRIKKYLDPSRYIIEVWRPMNSPLLTELHRIGYRTVSVPKDIWYLDHGFWGNTQYSNWMRMYGHRLPNNENMLGGEVAMWSELVDGNSLDTRVWPRAAAVAERLWSDPQSSASEAEPRLQRQRQRLMARGVRVDVLSPEWCAQHARKCV